MHCVLKTWDVGQFGEVECVGTRIYHLDDWCKHFCFCIDDHVECLVSLLLLWHAFALLSVAYLDVCWNLFGCSSDSLCGTTILTFALYILRVPPHARSKQDTSFILSCDSFTTLNLTGPYWKYDYALLFKIKSLWVEDSVTHMTHLQISNTCFWLQQYSMLQKPTKWISESIFKTRSGTAGIQLKHRRRRYFYLLEMLIHQSSDNASAKHHESPLSL